jgi:hypothetical protein
MMIYIKLSEEDGKRATRVIRWVEECLHNIAEEVNGHYSIKIDNVSGNLYNMSMEDQIDVKMDSSIVITPPLVIPPAKGSFMRTEDYIASKKKSIKARKGARR